MAADRRWGQSDSLAEPGRGDRPVLENQPGHPRPSVPLAVTGR
jgi:hypothetical protein